MMLLPYIDNSTGIDIQQITSLSDIYMVRTADQNKDINTFEPKYKYSNLQYGRCQIIN